MVFRDFNLDGVHDETEPGFSDVHIGLYDSEGVLVDEALSVEGLFSFTLVEIGEYTVIETVPEGYYSTTSAQVQVTVEADAVVDVLFGLEPTIVEEIPDISGAVFDDLDGDGLRSDGEPGIEGVSVELWRGETMTDETVTDEDGAYIFTDLPLDVYTVKEAQLDEWHSTTPDEVEADLTGAESAVVDFGETRGAVISGTVYNDANVNLVNNGEDGIPRVPVTLYLSDELVADGVTDAEGGYEFTVLKAGNYIVVEKNVDSYEKSSTPNRVEVPIVSLTGQTVTVNFGDYHIIPPNGPYYGTIRCYVFHDADDDGLWDEEESPVKGVTVELYQGEDSLGTKTTGEDGLANFGERDTGSYRVVETDLEGWVSSTDNTVTFTLSSKEIEEIEFGDRMRTRIMGVVYDDADVDKERDAEEEGIEDVTVQLFKGEVMVDDAVTSADGSYVFYVYTAGDYMVKEIDLTGWKSSTLNQVPVSVVEVEEEVHEVDFGDYLPQYGEIWGIAFNDDDDEGIIGEKDTGESGIEGVIVSLYDAGGLIATTTTDENGEYWFTELPPGVYEVKADDVGDYFRTTPGSVMPLVEAGDEKQVDFCYFIDETFGVIYGTVFNDKNGDMGRDFGELGLGGVGVSLVDLVTDTTNEYGCYSIRIDDAATYTLEETDPDGYHSTTPNEYSFPMQTASDNDSPWDFGDTLGATVSGVVWDDEDRDTVKGAEETGIEGVLVELYLGEVLVDSTETLEDGSYSFPILASGDYMVEETDPTGYDSSTPNEVPVSIGDLTGQMHTVDFGDYLIPVGTIEGTVFNDLNSNGKKDEGEGGLEGATVSIYNSDDELVAEVETGEDGGFTFEEMPLGLYRVSEKNLEGYKSTTVDSLVVEVELGTVKVVNFGDVLEIEVIPIFGVVFDDVNLNGVQDIELGIPGVTVGLYEDGEMITETLTGDFGNYILYAPSDGIYEVRETDLEGYMSTTPNEVALPVSTGNSYQVDFGDALVDASITVDKKVKRGDNWYDDVDLLTGESVEYQYTVKNTGNVPLINVQVVDDVLGLVTLDKTTLTPGQEATGTLSSTVQSGPHTNTATATGHYESTAAPYTVWDPEDEDTASYFGGAPGIGMDKQVQNINGEWVEGAVLPVDGTAHYRVVITNTGDVGLSDIYVDDPGLSVTGYSTDLPPGETTYGYADATVLYGSNSNEADVEAFWGSYDVSASDSAEYEGVDAYLYVTKLVKGYDGQWYNEDPPCPAYVKAGEEVEFWYLIDNMCELPFKEVTLYDDVLGWITLPSTDILGGEYIEAFAAGTALQGDHENVAEVNGKCGDYAFLGYSNEASYFGVETDTVFRKEVRAPGGDWRDDKVYVRTGDDVEYRFIVENNGNVDLTGLVMDDPDLGDPIDVGTVEAGNTYTSPTETVTSVAGTYTNTATLNGETILGPFAELSDSAEYEAAMPGITLTKEVSLDETNWLSTVEVPVGETVYFRFTVENTGDVEVTGLEGYDPDLGQAIEFEDTALASGGTTVNKNTVSVSALHGLNENTAEASAEWNGVQTDVDGSASYTGKTMELTVSKMVKDCWGVWQDDLGEVVNGALVEFKITVTNTGEVLLSDVHVFDAMFLTLSPTGLTLQPGETVIYTPSTTEAWTGYNEVWVDGDWNGYITDAYDDVYYDVVEPELGIEVLKEIKDSDGVWHAGIDTMSDPVEFFVGDTVTYRFTLTNTGNVGLVDIVVDDNVLGIIDMLETLAAGATEVSDEITRVAEAGLHENSVDVQSYDEINYDWIWDMDSASYFGVEPAPEITVTKEVSLDGSTGWTDHLDVVAGTTVWFRVQVENTGNTPLTGVEVQDSMASVPYVIGDMQPGEGWENTDSWIAEPGFFENTAAATGQYDGQDYSDDDVASVFGGVVEMTLTKYVKGAYGQWQDGSACAIVGTTVEYMYVLENTGNVPITVTVFSDVTLSEVFTTGALGVGEIWTEYASTTAELGVHSNQAVAEGHWSGNWVYADDWAQYVGTSLPSTVTVTLVKPHPTGLGYFLTTVSGGTSLDGIYVGWCIDSDTGAVLNKPFPANVYCSYGSLPMGLVEKPGNLDLINWIINQDYVGKIAGDGDPFTYGDLQVAIWTLIEDNMPPIMPLYSQAHVDEIVNSAIANGEGYVPGDGEYLVVILAPTSGGQPSIIKIQVP